MKREELKEKAEEFLKEIKWWSEDESHFWCDQFQLLDALAEFHIKMSDEYTKPNESEDLSNWLEWLYRRIPQLKQKHYTLWITKALEGYNKSKPKTKKSLEDRKEHFTDEVAATQLNGTQYKGDMLLEFIDYWTEHNEGGQKMRFEMSKNQPFNIKRRLVTWATRSKQFNNESDTKSTGANLDKWINS